MTTPLPRDDAYRERMKEAFATFRARERNYLLNLSEDVKRRLEPPYTPDWHFAASLSHYCELLFTLAGIKPCVLFYHGRDQGMVDQLIETCLRPVLEQFNILAYGFSLARISHDTPTQTHRGFRNGWVFVDLRHRSYPQVERVFLRPYSGRMSETEVGVALGYPTTLGLEWVEYLDETEGEYLRRMTGAPQTCCVIAMEYTCDDDPANGRRVFAHFQECAQAMRLVGRTLAISNRRR
ncbi:hypothetical protein V5O48_013504 [Marasmius crinis-equi]|uniref:Uncharacterized protein n=1 Tax=Marasmius crinis-equi TaxID=585013 RepID=A0ABR3EZV8_9AGAR